MGIEARMFLPWNEVIKVKEAVDRGWLVETRRTHQVHVPTITNPPLLSTSPFLLFLPFP
jgi:hypothetical protein